MATALHAVIAYIGLERWAVLGPLYASKRRFLVSAGPPVIMLCFGTWDVTMPAILSAMACFDKMIAGACDAYVL